MVAPGCKLKHKRSSNVNFVHQERSGLDLHFDIHCSIGAVDLHGSVLDMWFGNVRCHGLKRSVMMMAQAWNPNFEGEEELGKMQMNSSLMGRICRKTT